ncbi:ABC transporter substrate-binding protein [Planotetraspora sp. A-T 1434]|uniref:ABC transporter substrate-binding protein n=1 Tax=Planotetraspora sp. A-T 1434 TaxID=2979219 RepID=UPI0021C14A0B|nr:ABC transporter substrate-binding protein [Planotetraspora sp. A-T 1434]MCT9932273.1 ABC transporter substrate-binding protein [Planotetraspora sp. A-T 1434]
MRRIGVATACLALALAAGACGGVETGSSGTAQAPAANEKVSLSVWSKFSGRELGLLQKALDGFHGKHPNITVDNRGGQDDDKVAQAIRGGNPPDVAISFSTDNIGQFCSSGAWQDLKPYITRDKLDLNQIPAATRTYTEFKGTRCAMPLLADVYGLYYNKAMFAKAGITAPPKTMSELFEYAKKLTVFNPDGSIKVAGFVPTIGFYSNHVQMWAANWGVQWKGQDGKSALGTDPQWQAMLEWAKKFTDFYGKDKLAKFTAGLGQEYSPDQAFEKGQIAMAMDGEYRTAFITAEAPDLDYATAPFPVADNKPDLYGGGYTTGTIIGIPKGAKNAGAAWELVKYMSTDTGALQGLAQGLKNVPSTVPSLQDPTLQQDEHFKTFLDIFANPNLSTNPASSNGGAYLKTAEDFATSYQSGGVPDLKAGLAKTAAQIDADAQLGG